MKQWLRRWLGVSVGGLDVADILSDLVTCHEADNMHGTAINGTVASIGKLRAEFTALSNTIDSRHADSVAMYEVAKQNVNGAREILYDLAKASAERNNIAMDSIRVIEGDIKQIKSEQAAHLSSLSVILSKSNEITAADTREQCATLIETIALSHFRASHRATLAKLIREPLCR